MGKAKSKPTFKQISDHTNTSITSSLAFWLHLWECMQIRPQLGRLKMRNMEADCSENFSALWQGKESFLEDCLLLLLARKCYCRGTANEITCDPSLTLVGNWPAPWNVWKWHNGFCSEYLTVHYRASCQHFSQYLMQKSWWQNWVHLQTSVQHILSLSTCFMLSFSAQFARSRALGTDYANRLINSLPD